jgi:hypothetical protein
MHFYRRAGTNFYFKVSASVVSLALPASNACARLTVTVYTLLVYILPQSTRTMSFYPPSSSYNSNQQSISQHFFEESGNAPQEGNTGTVLSTWRRCPKFNLRS